jgi:hypothetical protein
MNDLIQQTCIALRGFASRIGHDFVWLTIALLFCLVEAAVLITSVRPSRLLRRSAAPLPEVGDLAPEPAIQQA